MLSLYGRQDEDVPLDLPRFDQGKTEGGSVHRRGVPVKRIGDVLVTTVYDLLLRSTGSVVPACPATGRATMTIRRRTRLPGKRRSPASTPCSWHR